MIRDMKKIFSDGKPLLPPRGSNTMEGNKNVK